MAEDSDLERTEPATGRRIEKAREDGQVPQSRELTAFMVLAAGAAGLWFLGGSAVRQAEAILRQGLSFDRQAAFDPQALGGGFAALSWEAVLLLAPFFLLTVAAALLTPHLMGSWIFTTKPLVLNFDRLNPVSGIKRIFSMDSVGELVKSILKVLLIGGVIVWMVWHQHGRIFALISQSVDVALRDFGQLLLFAIVGCLSGLAVIVGIDVPFQRWRYFDRLRMTKEEVRQEMKEMEGDPQLKGRIRSQQREIARRRMMAEVPKADVVVTNPTHFAVALKYDSVQMGAPQVVAKGMNLVAQRIRELAAEHSVPVLEAPPLARALYRHTEVGDQIPATLYTAVAEVMAYVYQLNSFMAGNGLPPAPPAAIAVPAGMDPGAVE